MGADVVVCNLTRFGDLLQSQAAIDDLHASGRRVGLVCLDNFASALPLLRNVSEVWKLPGAKLLAALQGPWPGAVATVLDFASSLGAPTHVLNLTPSLPARLLARLMANSGAEILGFGLDRDGYGVNRGAWSSFLAVAAGARVNSPFNVADLFRKIAFPLTKELEGNFRLAPPAPEAGEWARDFLATHAGNASPKGFIALQLGASEERRRWPVENFCAASARIWREAGLMPVLLGSKAELPLAKEFAAQATHPFINAVGATDLMQLAALLRETSLLITNDTGTMHLASGQGLPSLSFFLATAQPWDTGPLLPGSCCLEPAMDCHPCAFGQSCQRANACRSHIGADAAADLVLGWLPGHDWRAGATEKALSQARVWVTATDKAGLGRISRIGRKEDERGLWLGTLRVFWSQLLDEIDLGDFSDAPPPQLVEGEGLRNIAAQVREPLEQAENIGASIAELGRMAAKSSQASKLFLLNCERLQTTLDNVPLLGTMAGFWREARRGTGAGLEEFLPIAAAFGKKCGQLARTLAGE